MSCACHHFIVNWIFCTPLLLNVIVKYFNGCYHPIIHFGIDLCGELFQWNEITNIVYSIIFMTADAVVH